VDRRRGQVHPLADLAVAERSVFLDHLEDGEIELVRLKRSHGGDSEFEKISRKVRR